MTAQVTSERIPRHNPTAKPTLNGLDVPLSGLSTAKKAPLCRKFSHILFERKLDSQNKASNMVK